MEIKFNKSLNKYKYIVGFDLALYKTGLCIYDIQNNKVIHTETINNKDRYHGLYLALDNFITRLILDYNINLKDVLFVKEQCPKQAGFKSQISTLQALFGCHVILEIVLENLELDCYSRDGIHVTIIREYIKKQTKILKPTKEDVHLYLCEKYNLNKEKTGLDETDSLAVVDLLVYSQFNKDIDTEISKIQKEIKSLKAIRSIQNREDEIKRLELLKI